MHFDQLEEAFSRFRSDHASRFGAALSVLYRVAHRSDRGELSSDCWHVGPATEGAVEEMVKADKVIDKVDDIQQSVRKIAHA